MGSAVKTYSSRLQPAYPPTNWPVLTTAVKLPASVTYTAGTVLGELLGANEVQTLTEGTNITAGTFTLTFGGQTTSALQHDAVAATVQAALEALSTIGAGNVVVTGGPVGTTPFTITFQNDLGYQNVAQLTSDQTSLTGTFTHATSTAGSSGTDGSYKLYAAGNTDGSQTPKAILADDVTTNSDGKIVNNDGSLSTHATAFLTGTFRSDDVPTVTDAALTAKGGRWLVGNSAGGIFQW